MKRNFLLVIALLPYLLTSCGSDKITIQPKKLFWDKSNHYLLDSIYITKVEDKRKSKSIVLGTGYSGLLNSSTPVIFKYNLTEYLKINFNNLLSSAQDTLTAIPVSIELNKLQVGEEISFFHETAYSKYSYTFIYPKAEGISKIVIVDSIEISGGNDATSILPQVFYNGIKRTSQVFSEFYKTNSGNIQNNITTPDYTLSLISDDNTAGVIPTSVDTIRVIDKIRKRTLLSFGMYKKGTLLEGGFNIGYFTLFNKEGSHFEYGAGPEINFLNVKQHANLSSATFVSYNFPLIGRYYLQDKPQNFFLNGTFKINAGTETIDYGYSKNMNFFIGPTFEIGLGFQIGQFVDVTACVHQIYNWGSEILPNDFGVNFNAHISFGYKK